MLALESRDTDLSAVRVRQGTRSRAISRAGGSIESTFCCPMTGNPKAEYPEVTESVRNPPPRETRTTYANQSGRQKTYSIGADKWKRSSNWKTVFTYLIRIKK